jgi:uncharacterized membrane-anchored protein
VLSKVPALTLSFWIIKIAATALGETGGDKAAFIAAPVLVLHDLLPQ